MSARRAGDLIEISVRDEGPGIPPEQRRILFERFGRAPSRVTGGASPVAGAGANAKYTDGVAIFQHTKGGLMAAAAVGGQKFKFEPLR